MKNLLEWGETRSGEAHRDGGSHSCKHRCGPELEQMQWDWMQRDTWNMEEAGVVGSGY